MDEENAILLASVGSGSASESATLLGWSVCFFFSCRVS